jgi:hypothetical protein
VRLYLSSSRAESTCERNERRPFCGPSSNYYLGVFAGGFPSFANFFLWGFGGLTSHFYGAFGIDLENVRSERKCQAGPGYLVNISILGTRRTAKGNISSLTGILLEKRCSEIDSPPLLCGNLGFVHYVKQQSWPHLGLCYSHSEINNNIFHS